MNTLPTAALPASILAAEPAAFPPRDEGARPRPVSVDVPSEMPDGVANAPPRPEFHACPRCGTPMEKGREAELPQCGTFLGAHLVKHAVLWVKPARAWICFACADKDEATVSILPTGEPARPVVH